MPSASLKIFGSRQGFLSFWILSVYTLGKMLRFSIRPKLFDWCWSKKIIRLSVRFMVWRIDFVGENVGYFCGSCNFMQDCFRIRAFLQKIIGKILFLSRKVMIQNKLLTKTACMGIIGYV